MSDHAPSAPRYRRKLTNYLLDKRLQLRYVSFVTLLSAVICGSLGYLIWKQEDEASETIITTFDSTELAEEPGLKEQIVEDLTQRDNNLILTMIGVGIGLVIVLSLYLIVMTHKVAGPLYKVTRYFDKMRDGKLGEIYDLRKGDMLRGFYDKFREAHQSVRARHREENEVVGKFLEACEQAGVGGDHEIVRELDELRAHHKKREEALS